MGKENGLSVQQLSRIETSNFRNVIYVDFMLMALSEVQRIAIGATVIILLVLAIVGNVATVWVNARRWVWKRLYAHKKENNYLLQKNPSLFSSMLVVFGTKRPNDIRFSEHFLFGTNVRHLRSDLGNVALFLPNRS